jgi:hypothetical protein
MKLIKIGIKFPIDLKYSLRKSNGENTRPFLFRSHTNTGINIRNAMHEIETNRIFFFAHIIPPVVFLLNYK